MIVSCHDIDMPNEASAQGSARLEAYLHLTSDSSGKGKVTLIICHVMGLCKATEGIGPPLNAQLTFCGMIGAGAKVIYYLGPCL